jgi:hypothetical protein
MKMLALLIVAPALIIIGVLGGFLLLDGSPVVPKAPACGFTVGDSLAKNGADELSKGNWTVYTYGGEYASPQILTSALDAADSAAISGAPGCSLKISSLPPQSARKLDWRIGRVAVNVLPYRGKTVRFRMMLKADKDTQLGSANIYVYDGKTVTGMAVPSLSTKWRSFETIANIPADAIATEFWFRALFDKPDIKPVNNRLHMAAFVDEVAAPKISPPKAVTTFVPQDTRGSANCPTQISASFEQAVGQRDDRNIWQTYRYQASTPAPNVAISTVDDAGPNGDKVCRLVVSGGPEKPGSAIDWRMGKLVAVDGLRGKKVRFSVKFRADRLMDFDTSYIYAHFGIGNSIESATVNKLGVDWVEKSVTIDVPMNAQVAEFWYRLALDKGTIKPGEGTIDFAPSLEIID